MCIAIYKPAGKTLTRAALFNSFTSNRDGAGFAYVRDGEVNIQKGYFDFDRFYEEFSKFQEYQCLVHFRVATHKAVNGRNCHPWRVNDDVVFIHNGMISNCAQDDSMSDTGNFAEHVMKPLLAEAPDFWKTPQAKWVIEAAIGSGNKLVFLDSKGEHRIFNESAGYWDQGCWFSNKSYSSYSQNFYVTEEEEAAAKKYKEEHPEPEQPVPTSSSISEELSEHEKDVLQQRLTADGVEIVSSLAELDRRLEELNSGVVTK